MNENELESTTPETPAADPDKINAVGMILDGQFVPYGYAGFADAGTPVYVFNTEEEYNAVASSLPDPSVIITLDDLDTGGFKFDDEINSESENAVQNKIIYAAMQALKGTIDRLDVMVKPDGEFFVEGADGAIRFISETPDKGMRNAIFRGKYLGDNLTAEQAEEIKEGTFRDMFVGDFWTIGGVNWRIAHFDYWLNCGDTACTKHHAVIVPDTCLYSAQMNNGASTTEGGYIGTDMYKTGLNQAKTMIVNDFGTDHILAHRELLVNAVANGKPSGVGWYDSTVELMNEPMVYGSYIFAPACDGTTISYRYTIDKLQLALFAMRPDLICNFVNWWLRDVASGADFAYAGGSGQADCAHALPSLGVRPAFGIC